jgi:CRISPR/Cas system-associated exonuclease Cas4 (RecB family)
MAKIPEPTVSTASLIDEHHQKHQDVPRPHLGASLLGHHCERYLWLSFRWVRPEQFPGRILRLFRRGQNEESIIVNDLRAIGIDVKTTNGSQDRVDFGNHVSGSMDGIANYGVPEAPGKRHVLEMKTHNKKSFDDLEKHGVQKSKPQHYAQCQVYMLGSKIDRALYIAVCKDDDRYYFERVKLDRKLAKSYVEKGHRIVASDRIPDPISHDPTWYQCRMCSYYEFCHKAALPEVNCRTCAHSTACNDSTWRCERHDADNIPVDFQRTGCDDHALHPDVVPWEMDQDASTEHQPVYIIEGKPVTNGQDGYLSSEIVANPLFCSLDDDGVKQIKQTFPGAKIIG